MGFSQVPAPAAGKTMYRTTLLSGTSYTVPAGVTYLNVTLIGGGGGASGGPTGINAAGVEGRGGQIVHSTLAVTPGASITYAIGAGGSAAPSANSGGGSGGNTTFTGATTASGGSGSSNNGGGTGTAGISANNASGPGLQGNGSSTGGAGAIIIEYWV